MKPKEDKSAQFKLSLIANKITDMDDRCALYRGICIHYITKVEHQIDQILKLYFCDGNIEKMEEMQYAILSTEKITLSSKYNLVSFIMRRHYKEFYDANMIKATKINGKNKEPDKSIDTRVEYIISMRNKFAHRKLSYDINDIIQFNGDEIALRNKVNKDGKFKPNDIIIDQKFIDGFIDECYKLLYIFIELHSLIQKDTPYRESWMDEFGIKKED